LLETVKSSAAQHRRRVQTAMVNRVVQDAVLRNPPPPDRGREIRVYYATQVSTKPPRFAVWVSRSESIHFSYRRYLENALREAFDFSGTPIEVLLKQRD
jgi:GTP-binding protein